jgi:dTDP-4-dehydrorhamnose reductase
MVEGGAFSGRVVVTGAAGQLGRALLRAAPALAALVARERADLDISDAAAVATLLDAEQPSLLINAAAYTAVDRAEEDSAAAFRINDSAVGGMARLCAERGIRLLHVSTDFVFDGSAGRPYAPDALPRPLGVYGESKWKGEEALLASGVDGLILRTGWVYSKGPGNFVHTMLRLHREREEIAVVADQVGTPTAATTLASSLWAAAARPALKGIFHCSDAGVCSWYDFAVAIGEEAASLGLIDTPARVRPIRTEDYPTPAKRPSYSVLDKTTMWEEFELEPVHWRTALRATLGAISGGME